MFKIGIAVLILAISFILIILGLANVKEKMFTAFLQVSSGVAILLVVSWDWVKDWGIVAHISLGKALLILPMYVFAFIVGLKMLGGTKSDTKYAAHQAPKAQILSIGEHREHQDLFDKAAVDFEYIVSSLPDIQNQEVATLTKQLIKIATNLFHYVNEQPKRMPLAREFVNYYQDRTAELLRQYRGLKSTGVRSESFRRLECDMISTFQGFISAYEKQLEKVIETDVMNMNAEMKVARQIMRNDGISCETRKIDVAEVNNISLKDSNISIKQNEPEKTSDKGWNFKYVGAAAMGVVLGAFGVYKFFGKKQ